MMKWMLGPFVNGGAFIERLALQVNSRKLKRAVGLSSLLLASSLLSSVACSNDGDNDDGNRNVSGDGDGDDTGDGDGDDTGDGDGDGTGDGDDTGDGDGDGTGNGDGDGDDDGMGGAGGTAGDGDDDTGRFWQYIGDPDDDGYNGMKFRGVKVVDQDYLMVRFRDGDVVFVDDGEGDCAHQSCNNEDNNSVVRYGDPLDTSAAVSPASWLITSADDPAYGDAGLSPLSGSRKSKLNGMAQLAWVGSDYSYEHTMEHQIFLELPSSLTQGLSYTLEIDAGTNTDVQSFTFIYDIFNSRSEAVHVNLAGYHPRSAIHAADLYIWMGDSGARDYASLEGNRIHLFNVDTEESQDVGEISFWQSNAGEAQRYNFIQSDVWNIDFTGVYEPGVYRLAIEGVGASQDFIIGETAVFEPFKVSTLGFFYMRIGQDSLDMTPVPRRPLWIPGSSPADCTVVITDMSPYHADWGGGGDRWDSPSFFSNYVKSGAPENPNAKGGHSDALDWDRHLGHVSNIYDMLLPYILTRGAIGSDNMRLAESGNGIPDIIDEARFEVDFWLSLRFEGGYSHGITNPDSNTNILYQADNTAIAAWANSVNAAMLAEAFRLSGHADLKDQYLSEAVEAWNYASNLSDQMLDDSQDLGAGPVRGRDFRMTAAAYLYNLTGDTVYESVINEESVVQSATSEFVTIDGFNQLYAMAAYLQTEQSVNYPELQGNMRSSVIHQAKEKEVAFGSTRPSRRATDNDTGYFHTNHDVHRTILAHAVATEPADRLLFERALVLEADWGLGRNPANVIQMTTATTRLSSVRSIESAYTSGRDDGSPGMHPGHTPYMNLDDWDSSMIMGSPSWMVDKIYPGGASVWPRAELFFNTRFVWAHAEFTPQQTMRGKTALYGYLLGIDR